MTTETGDRPITAEALREIVGALHDIKGASNTVNNAKGRPSHPDPLAPVPVQREGRYIPTISLDPSSITKGIKGYEDHAGYVQCAVDAFSNIHTGLKRLSDAREAARKNDAWTPAMQILNVSKEADKLMDSAARNFDSARGRLQAGIKSLDDSLSKPLQTAADTVLSREVREHVKNLPNEKRMTFLNEALKKKDVKTLQAVLGAQSFLSGITDETQAHFVRAYHEQNSPEIAQRVQVMRKALELVENRSGLMFGEIEKALGAKFDTVSKLRKTHDAAEAALLLVNSVKP